MPAVRAIVADARKQNNTFSAYVLGIVRSAAFQMSQSEPVRTTEHVPSAERPTTTTGARR